METHGQMTNRPQDVETVVRVASDGNEKVNDYTLGRILGNGSFRASSAGPSLARGPRADASDVYMPCGYVQPHSAGTVRLAQDSSQQQSRIRRRLL